MNEWKKLEIDIFQSNIISCCQGKRKLAGGYIWKYVGGRNEQ